MRRTALILAAAPAVTTALGFALGWAWLLPFLGAAPAWFVFVGRVRAGRPASAAAWMLWWALFQSLAMGAAIALFPERAAEVVHRGVPYAAEMIHWARTGEGPEGSPRLFLPIHARHFIGFCALTLLTAGAAGLVLGTWLLNYMNYYVATLAAGAVHPWLAAGIGWPPWAVLRVVGYIATAAALAPWSLRLLGRLFARPTAGGPVSRRLLAAGLALVLADIMLKATLAPTWQRWVAFALDGR